MVVVLRVHQERLNPGFHNKYLVYNLFKTVKRLKQRVLIRES